MGRLDDFEERIEHVMDGAAGAMFKSPLNPVQIMRRAEKEMNREKLVSAGRQYAPTLYNVMVNVDDDRKLAGFYPTLAGEMETALKGKAGEAGLQMDGAPLVRVATEAHPEGEIHCSECGAEVRMSAEIATYSTQLLLRNE